MKIVEAVNLLQAIKALQTSETKAPVKFAYCLAKNAELLQKEVDIYTKTLQEDEDAVYLNKFETRRVEIIKQFCKMDSQGNPITENNSFTFDNTSEALQEIQKIIDDEFPELSDVLTRRQEAVADLEQQEINVDLYKLPIEAWPDVDMAAMTTLWKLVKD